MNSPRSCHKTRLAVRWSRQGVATPRPAKSAKAISWCSPRRVFLVVMGVAVMLGSAFSAHAAIPLMINHQGLIKVGAEPFTGNGVFKFGFIDAAGK